MCKRRCYLVCCEDLVDIVEGESFVFGQRQTRPDYGFGFNGRDEQDRLVVLDIVCEVRVRQCASRQVVEESTLSEVVAVNAGSREAGDDQPEWHRFVVVLDHPSLLPFQIEDSTDTWVLLSHPFHHPPRMEFGRVFACEDSFDVGHLARF